MLVFFEGGRGEGRRVAHNHLKNPTVICSFSLVFFSGLDSFSFELLFSLSSRSARGRSHGLPKCFFFSIYCFQVNLLAWPSVCFALTPSWFTSRFRRVKFVIAMSCLAFAA